jgi:predicted house-cleaning noncanonical NTP pyrophosphatase (MazG superfamily)
MIYNKLVRDKIPEIIRDKGENPITHIATEEEYSKKLKEKLKEEVDEFLEENSAEELADVLEVVEEIKKLKEFSEEDIGDIKQKKKDARGGFEEKIILEKVE